jgi:hypothetical protein
VVKWAISFNSQNNDMMTEGRRRACVLPWFPSSLEKKDDSKRASTKNVK